MVQHAFQSSSDYLHGSCSVAYTLLRPFPFASFPSGDPKRDKIRQLLCDGLFLVPEEQREGQDPAEVAAEVETAIYNRFNQTTGSEYGAKVGG